MSNVVIITIIKNFEYPPSPQKNIEKNCCVIIIDDITINHYNHMIDSREKSMGGTHYVI